MSPTPHDDSGPILADIYLNETEILQPVNLTNMPPEPWGISNRVPQLGGTGEWGTMGEMGEMEGISGIGEPGEYPSIPVQHDQTTGPFPDIASECPGTFSHSTEIPQIAETSNNGSKPRKKTNKLGKYPCKHLHKHLKLPNDSHDINKSRKELWDQTVQKRAGNAYRFERSEVSCPANRDTRKDHTLWQYIFTSESLEDDGDRDPFCCTQARCPANSRAIISSAELEALQAAFHDHAAELESWPRNMITAFIARWDSSRWGQSEDGLAKFLGHHPNITEARLRIDEAFLTSFSVYGKHSALIEKDK